MGVISTAVSWALSIANDNSHGYDQTNRWGPNYDCSSLVIQAYHEAGVPVKANGATYTGNMVSAFKKSGFRDVTKQINLSTGQGLKMGDVVWKNGHVEMCSRTGYLVGAHINEKGTTTGGVTGDQTGGEINERTYYNKPWTTVLRYTTSDEPSIDTDFKSGNRYLTLEEMQVNALYIYNQFSGLGWSLNAIAGMLGNMQRESTINPAIWQNLNEGNTSGGYGLVQWTPATKILEWDMAVSAGWDTSHIQVQCMKIHYEMVNGEQYIATSTYPMSFRDFSTSTESPEYLASVFLHNYERAGVSAEEERRTNARYWYDYLLNYEPDAEPEEKKKGLSLMLMYMATKKV